MGRMKEDTENVPQTVGTYAYDKLRNQITKTETGANGTVKELNRIQTETDPFGLVKAYTYDANNNLQTAITPCNAPRQL